MTQSERDRYMILRKRKKIKQSDLAKHLNVSQTFISLFEVGEREMSRKHMEMYKEYIDQN